MHTGTQEGRLKLNEHQRLVLEKSFIAQFYPNKTTTKELASQTGLSETKVRKWYEHTRFEVRKGKSIRKCTALPYTSVIAPCNLLAMIRTE